MLGIYVHVPFCVKKCGYCDFLSFPGMENCFRGYVKALCGEIESRGKLHGTEEGGKARVDTVFIGGGTPTVLTAEYLAEILGTVGSLYQENYAFNGMNYSAYLFPKPFSAEAFS